MRGNYTPGWVFFQAVLQQGLGIRGQESGAIQRSDALREQFARSTFLLSARKRNEQRTENREQIVMRYFLVLGSWFSVLGCSSARLHEAVAQPGHRCKRVRSLAQAVDQQKEQVLEGR